MEFDLNQLAGVGIDIQTGSEYTGGKDKYLAALQRFYRSSGTNRSKIREYIENSDMENLAITVHAIKSNAKMIGASELSLVFETMEMASRVGDLDTVKDHVCQAMDEYEQVLEVIKPLGEMETYRAAGELSGTEAKETADRLMDALDEFDDTAALELAEKLTGYPFRITQRGKLREAIDHIRDYMYDEAADLVREIIPEIE